MKVQGLKKGKRNFYSSLFSMILIINLCSIVVLSVFNYYVFHRLSGKAYLNSFLSYQEQVTKLAFRNIDDQIMQSVLKISQLHFSDIRENEPLLLAQGEDISTCPEKVRILTTEMKKIQKTYPYIQNIDIYYEGTQTIVTGFDKVHFPTNESRIEQYVPWYQKYQEGDITEGFCFLSEGIYLSKEPVISYIKKISQPKWGDENIVLAISIYPQRFSQYIDQQAGEVSIVTREKNLLYDSDGLEREDSKADNTAFQYLSSITGLTYTYRVDTARFYEDYYITSRMFLINFFISIAFNLLVLLLISYYSYKIYRKRVLTMTEEAGVSIQNKDISFEGSLHALTNQITDLHAVVQSSKGMVFQNAVRAVLLNRKVEEGNKELEAYLNGDSVCTFMIELVEQEVEVFFIEKLQEEFLPGQGSYDVLFTCIEKDSLIAVLLFVKKEKERICADFIRRMEVHYKSARLVSGAVCPRTEEGMVNSYQSALNIQSYRYIMTKDSVLSWEQIKIKDRKESGSHSRIFEAIHRDINKEDLLELKLHLEMLLESFRSGNYTIEYCISTLRDLVTLFYQVMQQYRLDMWVVFGYDIREYYKKIPNLDSFHSWSDAVCEMILKNIHQKKMAVDIDVRTQILTLVEEHLENNITLDFLAEQLKTRPDAASRIFRQTMGIGYTEYIKDRKLKRAIELLEQGSSIKEIAEILGYSTSQYFIKVFKETYGMTPYQYKKNK